MDGTDEFIILQVPGCQQVARLPGCQVARLPAVASGCQRLPAKVASDHMYVLATAVASWLPGCQRLPAVASGCQQRLPVTTCTYWQPRLPAGCQVASRVARLPAVASVKN
jgi:hypothetical protein